MCVVCVCSVACVSIFFISALPDLTAVAVVFPVITIFIIIGMGIGGIIAVICYFKREFHDIGFCH